MKPGSVFAVLGAFVALTLFIIFALGVAFRRELGGYFNSSCSSLLASLPKTVALPSSHASSATFLEYMALAYAATCPHAGMEVVRTRLPIGVGSEWNDAGAVLRVFSDGAAVTLFSFRGTFSMQDVLLDAMPGRRVFEGYQVYRGFFDAFSRSLAWFEEHARIAAEKRHRIFLVGHSLGAAEAVLANVWLCKNLVGVDAVAYVAACPRVGCLELAESLGDTVYHLRNGEDLVPCLPRGTPQSPLFGPLVSHTFFINTGVADDNHSLQTYTTGAAREELMRIVTRQGFALE